MITPKAIADKRAFQTTVAGKHKKITAALMALGVAGLTAGCGKSLAVDAQANAQALPANTPLSAPAAALPAAPAALPIVAAPTATPIVAPPTVAPTNTPWPTPTAWPTPAPWRPVAQPLPTLAAVPIVAGRALAGGAPGGYSPPNGVDVFGATILRWEFPGYLAPDEYFDIKIKPYGSQNSAFVAWSKSKEFVLTPCSGWQPGLYTWQIGVVQGYIEGGAKHFVADTGRDSQPMLIKWQAGGGNHSGGPALIAAAPAAPAGGGTGGS